MNIMALAYISVPPNHNLDKEEENMTTSRSEDRKEFIRGQRDYWRQLAKSDGFDIDDVSVPERTISGLWSVDCQHPRFKHDSWLPKLYGMVGLHRYNMIKGTNFTLSSILKYNMTMNCVSSYYITLVARDAAQDASSQLLKTFQVRVDEKSFGKLDLTCSIARLKDEEEVTTNKRFIPHFHVEAASDDFYKGPLPDWPSVDDLNDPKRFYVLNESELQSNDWISLYLQLALYMNDEFTMRDTSPELQILKVAIGTKEDVQPPNGRLRAKSAHVYITYKGFPKPPIREIGEIGVHVERRAIIRRVIDERTGYLTLLGGFSSEEKAVIAEQPVSGEEALDNEQSSQKRPRLE